MPKNMQFDFNPEQPTDGQLFDFVSSYEGLFSQDKLERLKAEITAYPEFRNKLVLAYRIGLKDRLRGQVLLEDLRRMVEAIMENDR